MMYNKQGCTATRRPLTDTERGESYQDNQEALTVDGGREAKRIDHMNDVVYATENMEERLYSSTLHDSRKG